MLSAVLFGIASGARAEGPAAGREDPNKPSTSHAAREEALQSIPTAKLSAVAQAKVNWAVTNSSIFRRLPIRVVPCDPDMYLFLVEHPDVVVNIWETLGAENLTMRQTGPDTYHVTDDIGTTGTVEYLYRSHDTNLIYFDGTYRGALFGETIRARGLMVLRSGYVRETDGRYFMTSRVDAFMHVEPSGVEFITKTFLPTVGKVADNNFSQTVAFVASVSRTAETNNRGMKRLATKLAKVKPEVRDEFVKVSDQVAQRAAAASGDIAASAAASPTAGNRLAQRPDRTSPLPAADLAPTLVQSPGGEPKRDP